MGYEQGYHGCCVCWWKRWNNTDCGFIKNVIWTAGQYSSCNILHAAASLVHLRSVPVPWSNCRRFGWVWRGLDDIRYLLMTQQHVLCQWFGWFHNTMEYSSLVFKSIKATSMLERFMQQLALVTRWGGCTGWYLLLSLPCSPLMSDALMNNEHLQTYHDGEILLIRRLSLGWWMVHWSCIALPYSPIVEDNSGFHAEFVLPTAMNYKCSLRVPSRALSLLLRILRHMLHGG